VTVVTLGMVIGGMSAATYFLVSRDDPAPPPPPAPAAGTGTPQELAQAVVARLNAKDLTGVIELTCAQGKATGRRELVKAIPALDPDAPAEVRGAAIEFELRDVNEFPDGYVAAISVRFDGTAQDGTMRIQRTGEKWTLCGMNSPRVGAAVVGSG
jgi:hypothetical protein